ncbi:MAG: dTDP-4-dehydrorhamnose reductase [Planctomycetota bacterium]|nr:dTDP-4-dehydrorhamnose reductase [Planctomycetota bacterium]
MGDSVLVIGGSGMLGRAVCNALAAQGTAFDAPSHATLDLLNAAALKERVPGHTHVINCAAWTDVDKAETAEADATLLNGTYVGLLASICAEHHATLVHYSTDYVFDGEQGPAYAVDAPMRPLNAYGRSKAVGERLIAEHARLVGGSALVIRTSWLYAPWGRNFVRTIAAAARQRPTLRVVNDQRGRPTSCEHLARTTLRLLAAQARGVLHVTDGGEATWFDFATRIAATANPDCRVEPCTSAEYPRPAKRPANSVLDLGPTEELVGPMPHWHANLDSVLSRLEP